MYPTDQSVISELSKCLCQHCIPSVFYFCGQMPLCLLDAFVLPVWSVGHCRAGWQRHSDCVCVFSLSLYVLQAPAEDVRSLLQRTWAQDTRSLCRLLSSVLFLLFTRLFPLLLLHLDMCALRARAMVISHTCSPLELGGLPQHWGEGLGHLWSSPPAGLPASILIGPESAGPFPSCRSQPPRYHGSNSGKRGRGEMWLGLAAQPPGRPVGRLLVLAAGARPASGDALGVRPLHPHRWRRHPGRPVPRAFAGRARRGMRRIEKGEGHPPAGGHAVCHRSNQQGPWAAAQRHAGRTHPGHVLARHLRPGAVAHLCAGAHWARRVGCALCQRRPAHLHQARQDRGCDRRCRQLRLHHGGQHPAALQGKGSGQLPLHLDEGLAAIASCLTVAGLVMWLVCTG